jgi:hypothetical protein
MASIEILIEIKRIGAIVRVSAIETESGTEVIFQAPASTSSADLKKLASNKLRYVMKKEALAKGRFSGKND